MFSWGTLAAPACSINDRRVGFVSGLASVRAALEIAARNLEKVAPFFLSCASFLCFICFHLLCPAIFFSLLAV